MTRGLGLTPVSSDVRAMVCRRDTAGGWLCAWCTRLPVVDGGTLCESCNAQQLPRSDEERTFDDWKRRQRGTIARMLTQLPTWEHLTSAEATAAKRIAPKLARVAEAWDPSKGSLLLLGPSGAGKTTAIGRAVHRLATQRLDARVNDPGDLAAKRDLFDLQRLVWMKASHLVRAWTEHPFGARQEPDHVARAVEATILVVDELGPENPAYAGQLFDVVDRRADKRLPTVVTSGQTLDAIATKYGTGMKRRLIEEGLGHLIDAHADRGRIGR